MGRKALLADLSAQLAEGNTVLLHGPWGIGKSALLAELRRCWRARGRPCGLARQTRVLNEVTRALAEAYPEAASPSGPQRRLRSALRMAVESNPGLLFLDHVAAHGTALKGFLRSLEGTGLGVLLAVDVEDRRDHERARALALAYREVEVPPLPPRHLRLLLDSGLAEMPHRRPADADRAALIELAAGRPGWVRDMVRRLAAPQYWGGDRVLVELLRCDLSLEVMAHHLQPGM